jgi:hypothetical protein
MKLAALFLIPACLALAQVPTPESVLGHKPGDDFYLASYDESLAYFQKLVKSTDKLKLVHVGKTTRGLDWYIAVISSAPNLASLDKYKDTARRLALVKGLTDAQAHDLAHNGKVIVHIDGGLHATEVAPAHFKAAGEALAAQFDAYKPFPDLAVNGHQTLSENIADVAGLLAAYDAYRLSLHGAADVSKDGFTGDQRFFISFAQSWRSKIRDEELRREIATDGHAPDQYRAVTVRNLDAWYDAFSVRAPQKLYLAPSTRARIW